MRHKEEELSLIRFGIYRMRSQRHWGSRQKAGMRIYMESACVEHEVLDCRTFNSTCFLSLSL